MHVESMLIQSGNLQQVLPDDKRFQERRVRCGIRDAVGIGSALRVKDAVRACRMGASGKTDWRDPRYHRAKRVQWSH